MLIVFDAVAFREIQPKASPNAGFMQQLMQLDKTLHGTCSLTSSSSFKRGKPEPRVCEVCGMAVGVSQKSLDVHMKTRHGDILTPPLPTQAQNLRYGSGQQPAVEACTPNPGICNAVSHGARPSIRSNVSFGAFSRIKDGLI